MDPVSIIAIVGGVVVVVRNCIQTYQVWNRARAEKKTISQNEKINEAEEVLGKELQSTAPKVQAEYNQFALRLGSKFVRNGDAILHQDFKAIIKRQRNLNKDVKKIQTQPSSSTDDNRVLQQIRSATTTTRGIQDAMIQALRRFSERTTPKLLLDSMLTRPENLSPLKSEEGVWPRPFCYGALLLQSRSDLDGSDLAINDTDRKMYILAFTCKYCYLEVGDYRMSDNGKTLISTRLLAASHVTSCASFSDRRASYKCLVCYAKHRTIDFGSAAALEHHLQTHPQYDLPRNAEEKDLAEELQITEESLDLEPADDDGAEEQDDNVNVSVLEEIPSISTSDGTLAPRTFYERPVSPIDQQFSNAERNASITSKTPAWEPQENPTRSIQDQTYELGANDPYAGPSSLRGFAPGPTTNRGHPSPPQSEDTGRYNPDRPGLKTNNTGWSDQTSSSSSFSQPLSHPTQPSSRMSSDSSFHRTTAQPQHSSRADPNMAPFPQGGYFPQGEKQDKKSKSSGFMGIKRHK